MGYNGNNRGRTHRWSGVGDKRHYNWGLNLTAKAMTAPIVLAATLIDLAGNSAPVSSQESLVTFSSKNDYPLRLIQLLKNDTDKIQRDVLRQKAIPKDIAAIKREILMLRLNVFQIKKSQRKVKALKYIISRRLRLIHNIKLSDYYEDCDSVNANIIKGRVAILNSDQGHAHQFSLGCKCKKDLRIFQKHIEHPNTLSIRTGEWQILFFSSIMLLENKSDFVVIPYNKVSVSYKKITEYCLDQSYGYEVVGRPWYHSRTDGGPDRRYKDNYQLYNICRHQIRIQIKDTPSMPLYLILDNTNDANNVKKLFISNTLPKSI